MSAAESPEPPEGAESSATSASPAVPAGLVVNGSAASPNTGCPSTASRRLYARARSNSSIAIGYGHPATVRAAESDVSAKRHVECACMANGNDATTTAPTISSTDTHRTNMKRIRRSLRARTTSAMSIAS